MQRQDTLLGVYNNRETWTPVRGTRASASPHTQPLEGTPTTDLHSRLAEEGKRERERERERALHSTRGEVISEDTKS